VAASTSTVGGLDDDGRGGATGASHPVHDPGIALARLLPRAERIILK